MVSCLFLCFSLGFNFEGFCYYSINTILYSWSPLLCGLVFCVPVYSFIFFSKKVVLINKKKKCDACEEKFGLYPTPIPKDKVGERKKYDHRFTISNYDNAYKEKLQMCVKASASHMKILSWNIEGLT